MSNLDVLLRKRGGYDKKSKYPCGNPKTCQGYTMDSVNNKDYRRCVVCGWRDDTNR